MQQQSGSRRPYLRYIHEALFALNTACAIVLFVFSSSTEAYTPFAHLEVRINHLLHVRQTDFIRGHFQFWIPALCLTFCFWLLLRVFSRAQLTNRLLRSLAGVAAFFLLPGVWICVDPQRGRLFVWPYEGPLELALVIFVILLVLYLNLSISIWVGLATAAIHYVFWYWLFNGFSIPNWSAPGYFGPIGLVVGFCSAIVWVLALRVSSRIALPD